MTNTQPPTHQSTPTTATAAPLPTRDLQRAGGVAALIEGATYIVGIGVMTAYLAPRGFLEAQGDPAASLTVLLDNQVVMFVWYLLIYLVAGAALVVLSLGIHDRLRHATPALAQVTTAFGLIWSGVVLASGMVALVGQRAAVELAATDRSEAVSTWSAVSTVQTALGGGTEIIGAIWIILLSVAALRGRTLSRSLAFLGIAVGVAGTCTLIPQVADAGAVFGIGFIAWYLWAGRTLLRP